MRFISVRWPWPSLAVQPLIALVVLTLRLRANRVKIASVAASAFVGTVLVGFPAALTPIIAASIISPPVRNPTLEFIVLLGYELTLRDNSGQTAEATASLPITWIC
mgnify:CR=1 FL=1